MVNVTGEFESHAVGLLRGIANCTLYVFVTNDFHKFDLPKMAGQSCGFARFNCTALLSL
jgi:hypothetical protein